MRKFLVVFILCLFSLVSDAQPLARVPVKPFSVIKTAQRMPAPVRIPIWDKYVPPATGTQLRYTGPETSGIFSKSSVSANPYVSASKLKKAIFPSVIQETQGKVNAFPELSEIDAVIFDLDGTLLDSLSAWENASTRYVESRGFTMPKGLAEELSKMSLLEGAILIKEKFRLHESPEKILEDTLSPVKRRYETDLPLKIGVSYLLMQLHMRGIKMAVATASDKALAEAALRRLNVRHMFDFIITCDEVGVGKRNPFIYEQALSKLGTEKNRTLVVEDAPYAVHTAKEAGFPVAGVFDAHHPRHISHVFPLADYYIHSFMGLSVKP